MTGQCTTNDYDATVEWFAANEWKEWHVPTHESCDRQWFKGYSDEPMCKTNEPKPLQLRAMLWDRRKYGTNNVGLELELRAEPVKNDGWIVIQAYAFDSVEQVPHQIERILKAWRAMCSLS